MVVLECGEAGLSAFGLLRLRFIIFIFVKATIINTLPVNILLNVYSRSSIWFSYPKNGSCSRVRISCLLENALCLRAQINQKRCTSCQVWLHKATVMGREGKRMSAAI